jgi:hypothetical protein
MGFFERLFGKNTAALSSDSATDADDLDDLESIRPTAAQPIDGPPELVRGAELQRRYWTHDADEQAELEKRGFEQLDWRERLRLHHLTCLQRLDIAGDRTVAAQKCRTIAQRLVAADSPCRPRPAMIWKRRSAQLGAEAEPDLVGELLNPSLTHLGSLEFFHVDAAGQPAAIDFVAFDELAEVAFASPTLIRAAKLFYEDGRAESVLVPLLYGSTWSIGNEFDRAGRMTRFVVQLEGQVVDLFGASGIGVGHQDFSIRDQDGSSTLFGLGAVASIAFPLDMSDPRFDEKARARGMDPDDARRQMS